MHCFVLSAETSGGKHLWEAQLFCDLNLELAKKWDAWEGIPWNSWTDQAVCCLLLPVALRTWSCLLPCSASSAGLIPCWADLAHQASRKTTQLRVSERVVGVLASASSWNTNLRHAVGIRNGLPIASLRCITSWVLLSSSNTLNFRRELCLTDHP